MIDTTKQKWDFSKEEKYAIDIDTIDDLVYAEKVLRENDIL